MDATAQPSQLIINAQKELARRRRMAGVSYRPPQTMRSADLPVTSTEQCPVNSSQNAKSRPTSCNPQDCQGVRRTSDIQNPKSEIDPLPIRLSPSLAAHCLNRDHRHNGAALDGPYRLYKILQALDQDGRGWLANSDIEPLLTKKKSAFYIYGRRRLKIILRRGEGLFWNRVKSKGQVRIRLLSRARLFERLSPGSRLRGREVEIPLSYLIGSGRGRQADVNAAFYAAVHAGRLRPDRIPRGPRGARGDFQPRPISRAKLQELAGCSRYRQRSYEKRMHIDVRANIHILGAHSDYALERARRHYGLPAYKHTDYQGKIDRHKRGASYIAVRLPNSYQAPDVITVLGSRRQRTINRFLDGLCHMGSGGSGSEPVVRLFHRDAAAAVRASQRDQQAPAYWPLTQRGTTRLWQIVRSDDSTPQARHQSAKALTTNEQTCNLQRASSIPHSTLLTPHSKGGDLD